jgi:hypothetical protein
VVGPPEGRAPRGANTLARACVELPMAWCCVRIGAHAGVVTCSFSAQGGAIRGMWLGLRLDAWATSRWPRDEDHVAHGALNISPILGYVNAVLVEPLNRVTPSGAHVQLDGGHQGTPVRTSAGTRTSSVASEELRERHEWGHGAEPNCRVLTEAAAKIVPSTYYARKSRPPSARSVTHGATTAGMKRVLTERCGVHGVRNGPCRAAATGASGAPLRPVTADAHRRPAGHPTGTTLPGAGPDARRTWYDRRSPRIRPDQPFVADMTYGRTFSG